MWVTDTSLFVFMSQLCNGYKQDTMDISAKVLICYQGLFGTSFVAPDNDPSATDRTRNNLLDEWTANHDWEINASIRVAFCTTVSTVWIPKNDNYLLVLLICELVGALYSVKKGKLIVTANHFQSKWNKLLGGTEFMLITTASRIDVTFYTFYRD